MQGYVSPVLYHMVGSRHADDGKSNFNVLCQILRSHTLRCREVDGQRGNITKVDYRRVIEDGEPIIQSVVCVADIPLIDLGGIHASKYGFFGVGIDKALFAARGGRPVIYVPFQNATGAGVNNYMARRMLTAHEALRHYFSQDTGASNKVRTIGAFPESPGEAVDEVAGIISRDVLAFFKYFDIGLAEDHPESFYMEREWRKFGNFEFHDALRQVVVPEEYVGKLRSEFPDLVAEVVNAPP